MQLIREASVGQEFVKTLPGITAPIGFFDPLGLTPESKEDVLVWREAEVMHGRVAMMATVGFVVQESFHPLFPGAVGPAAFQLDYISAPEQALLLLLPIFMTEIARARKGWVEPVFTDGDFDSTVRTLRDDYTPGDRTPTNGRPLHASPCAHASLSASTLSAAVGFDPLSLKPKEPEALLEMQNKELNNGRLAMITIAGIVAQEVQTGFGVFGA